MTLRRPLVWTAAVIATALQSGSAETGRHDLFTFFRPLVTVDASDYDRLDRGEVVVHVLPGRDGELGVFAAARLDAPAETLVAWTQAIAQLKQSAFVLAIRRFSDPPVLDDLDGLVLDEVDVDAIRRCRTGDCGIKLAARDIEALRAAGARAGADWRGAVQQEFKRVVLDRVAMYRSTGLAGLPPYADRREPMPPADAMRAILSGASYLEDQLPDVTARLQDYPAGDLPGVESLIYWSKEQYGAGKRVISVTHVEILHPAAPLAPAVLVLGKEIFATHYRTGSLGVTAVVQDPARDQRYLVYVNRSQVDLLNGLFGGLKRRLIEGRLASESAAVVRLVRSRLESGAPAELGRD